MTEDQSNRILKLNERIYELCVKYHNGDMTYEAFSKDYFDLLNKILKIKLER